MANRNRKDRYEIDSVRIISTILANLILFGVPFGIGILIGHFFW